MVGLTALWLPILLSAVAVFVASSVIHMVLPIHRNDYKKLPDEKDVLAAMRSHGVAPGEYYFPHASSPKEFGTPEMLAKFKDGPVGMITVMQNGPPAMGKNLAQWFGFSLAAGVFIAYVTGHAVQPGDDYLAVFRMAGTVGFLAYAGAFAQDSIWKGQSWILTAKHTVDGLVYALLTAGIFSTLWP